MGLAVTVGFTGHTGMDLAVTVGFTGHTGMGLAVTVGFTGHIGMGLAVTVGFTGHTGMDLAYFRLLTPRIWKWPNDFFFGKSMCPFYIVVLHVDPGLRTGGAKTYASHCMHSDNTFSFTLTPQPHKLPSPFCRHICRDKTHKITPHTEQKCSNITCNSI
jgi:hypothetical protein